MDPNWRVVAGSTERHIRRSVVDRALRNGQSGCVATARNPAAALTATRPVRGGTLFTSKSRACRVLPHRQAWIHTAQTLGKRLTGSVL